MDGEQLARIALSRLEKWLDILISAGGTPIMLLAVNNNEGQREPFICMIDGINDNTLCNLLLHVIAQLQQGKVTKN